MKSLNRYTAGFERRLLVAIRMSVEEKGLFAENMIANMFIGSGRRIFHNGTEKTNADFYKSFSERKKNGDKISYDPKLRQLLSKPDFIVECPDGEYDFVEVKFRSIRHLSENEEVGSLLIPDRINMEKHLESAKEFWKPKIILMTDKPLNGTGNFTVLIYPYIEIVEGKTKVNSYPMGEIFKWGINSDIVRLNEEIIAKTFLD